MRCDDVEQKLMVGKELTAEERRHLDACRSCREFQRLVRELNGAPFDGPSADLDRLVKRVVSRELGGLRRRRLWHQGLVALSAAACLVLLLGVWWPQSERIPLAESSSSVAQVELPSSRSPEFVPALSSEEAELLAFEEELGLLSTLSLDLESGGQASVEEALAELPGSELAGMNDELSAMEMMFKEL